jgi:hypothetical protein
MAPGFSEPEGSYGSLKPYSGTPSSRCHDGAGLLFVSEGIGRIEIALA